jgi:hypothetical protein
MSVASARTNGFDPTNGAGGPTERRTMRGGSGITLSRALNEDVSMTRNTTYTPVRAGGPEHSHPVEELIKRLIREGSSPASEVVIARPVTIVDDDSGSDPYNHTGRFRKIFK